MPGHLQETEVAARGVHLSGHRPFPRHIPLVKRCEIDDGNRAGRGATHAHRSYTCSSSGVMPSELMGTMSIGQLDSTTRQSWVARNAM